MNVYTAEIKIQLFTQKVLNWFNQVNACQISPTTEETLSSITAGSHDTTILGNSRTLPYLCTIIIIFIQASLIA